MTQGDEPDPVEIPIEDALDLHPFRPSETAQVVESYLEEAVLRGFREVRLIHGRGIGAQRATVRATLARSPLVTSFRDAEPGRGGWGATVATLATRDARDTRRSRHATLVDRVNTNRNDAR